MFQNVSSGSDPKFLTQALHHGAAGWQCSPVVGSSSCYSSSNYVLVLFLTVVVVILRMWSLGHFPGYFVGNQGLPTVVHGKNPRLVANEMQFSLKTELWHSATALNQDGSRATASQWELRKGLIFLAHRVVCQCEPLSLLPDARNNLALGQNTHLVKIQLLHYYNWL